MRSNLRAGVLCLLLLSLGGSRPVAAYYLSGGGVISYLGQDTYRVSLQSYFVFYDIYAELGIPHENNGYPIGVYPNAGPYESLTGDFGTPFNFTWPDAVYGVSDGYLFTVGGMPTFDVQFNSNVGRTLFHLSAARDYLVVEFHPTYDSHDLRTAYGEATFFADLPNVIGESAEIAQTPEPPSGILISIALGIFAALTLHGTSRASTARR